DEGVELNLDGVFAGAVEGEDVAIAFSADFPAGVRGNFGECDFAGNQIERAAFGVLHFDDCVQREGSALAVQVAGEFEVVEGDVVRAGDLPGGGDLGGEENERGAEDSQWSFHINSLALQDDSILPSLRRRFVKQL